MSGLSTRAKLGYLSRLSGAHRPLRCAGQPALDRLDEADLPLGGSEEIAAFSHYFGAGVCLVTWRPDRLPEAVRTSVDVTITVSGQTHPVAGQSMAHSRCTLRLRSMLPRA